MCARVCYAIVSFSCPLAQSNSSLLRFAQVSSTMTFLFLFSLGITWTSWLCFLPLLSCPESLWDFLGRKSQWTFAGESNGLDYHCNESTSDRQVGGSRTGWQPSLLGVPEGLRLHTHPPLLAQHLFQLQTFWDSCQQSPVSDSTSNPPLLSCDISPHLTPRCRHTKPECWKPSNLLK